MSRSSQPVGRQQPAPQLVAGNTQYDDYLYYPYYQKAAPNGGVEYVPEPPKETNVKYVTAPRNEKVVEYVTEPPRETQVRYVTEPPKETQVRYVTAPPNEDVEEEIEEVIEYRKPRAVRQEPQVEYVYERAPRQTVVQKTVVQHEQREHLDSERDRVRVIVRVRPMNDREHNDPKEPRKVLHCVDEKSIIVDGGQQNRRFTFDSVFDEASTQEEVFTYCGIKRLVNMAIDGYIATCFAYGQTGSGKTHTMIGADGANIFRMDKHFRAENLGIVPRAINYLFRQLQERSVATSSPYYIRVSYCEIYNEQIRDLIRPTNPDMLQVRGSVEDGFYVENLYQTYIETMDELLTILEEGELNRAMASHKLNETSSRSHALLSIQIEQDQESNGTTEQMTRQGKLIFVDLAGSEKVKLSHSKGSQLVETNNINKSLLTLGTCISALSDPNKRAGHVPYRDSKLTRLLSESLGGHGITLMIACISPSRMCENESCNTLRYASRAKNIENAPIVKTDSKLNVITRLKLEVRKLKGENHELRRQLTGMGTLPRLKSQNYDSAGSQTSIRSAGSNGTYDHDGGNGVSTYEIRNRHETLTRENQKLTRQLYERDNQQQGQTNGRRVYVVEEEDHVDEGQPTGRRQVVRTQASEPDEEILEMVRRPSYLTRYRTVRNHTADAPSPQRRTTTVVRRAE